MKNKQDIKYEPIISTEERLVHALEVLLSDGIGESVVDFDQHKADKHPSHTKAGE